jgi:hypothetical protein
MVGVGVLLAAGLTYVATRSTSPRSTSSDASAAPSPNSPNGPRTDAGMPDTFTSDNPQGPQDRTGPTGDHPYDPNAILDLGPANNGVGPVPDVPGDATWRVYSPAGASESALLDPVRPGFRIADAQVVFVTAVDGGVIRVVLLRGTEEIHLAVALAGSPDRTAPARVGRYAVYIYDTTSPSIAAAQLAQALANLLRPHANMPPPTGMTEASTETRNTPGPMRQSAPPPPPP